jgi:hypothetical protein
MTALAVNLGVDESVAPVVPALVLMAGGGILLKLILPGKDAASKSSTKRRTPFSGKTPDPDAQILSPSAGRVMMRHFDRTDIKLKCQYTCGERTEPHSAIIISLSLSGLGFVTDEPLEMEERIRFTIPCPDKTFGDTFQIAGAIVREKPLKKKQIEYGVQFFHVFTRDQQILKRIIEKHS